MYYMQMQTVDSLPLISLYWGPEMGTPPPPFLMMMMMKVLLAAFFLAYPTTNGGVQKWKLSWNMYKLHTRFCTLGADLHAQSVLIDKISASQLSRKFIKSALLVGHTHTPHTPPPPLPPPPTLAHFRLETSQHNEKNSPSIHEPYQGGLNTWKSC